MDGSRSISLARVGSRVFFVALIATGHLLLALQLRKPPAPAREMSANAQPVYADFFSPDSADQPAPARVEEIERRPIDFPLPDLPADALSAANEATIEAPQIDPQSVPDIRSYTERAELAAGRTVSVTLEVAVGADGVVTSAQVVRSNGGNSANAAALDYARATRWIPGMIDGQPHAMQASLTVILGERA